MPWNLSLRCSVGKNDERGRLNSITDRLCIETQYTQRLYMRDNRSFLSFVRSSWKIIGRLIFWPTFSILGTPLRCRSSTNNEDLVGINGADLYDSLAYREHEGHTTHQLEVEPERSPKSNTQDTLKRSWRSRWNVQNEGYRLTRPKQAPIDIRSGWWQGKKWRKSAVYRG